MKLYQRVKMRMAGRFQKRIYLKSFTVRFEESIPSNIGDILRDWSKMAQKTTDTDWVCAQDANAPVFVNMAHGGITIGSPFDPIYGRGEVMIIPNAFDDLNKEKMLRSNEEIAKILTIQSPSVPLKADMSKVRIKGRAISDLMPKPVDMETFRKRMKEIVDVRIVIKNRP